MNWRDWLVQFVIVRGPCISEFLGKTYYLSRHIGHRFSLINYWNVFPWKKKTVYKDLLLWTIKSYKNSQKVYDYLYDVYAMFYIIILCHVVYIIDSCNCNTLNEEKKHLFSHKKLLVGECPEKQKNIYTYIYYWLLQCCTIFSKNTTPYWKNLITHNCLQTVYSY